MLQTRPQDMAVERKPAAFGDLRGWIAALKAQGELAEVNAEVDWNIELGTVMRLAQGPSSMFRRRIGTGSTAAAISSPLAAASPRTRKRES